MDLYHKSYNGIRMPWAHRESLSGDCDVCEYGTIARFGYHAVDYLERHINLYTILSTWGDLCLVRRRESPPPHPAQRACVIKEWSWLS